MGAELQAGTDLPLLSTVVLAGCLKSGFSYVCKEEHGRPICGRLRNLTTYEASILTSIYEQPSVFSCFRKISKSDC